MMHETAAISQREAESGKHRPFPWVCPTCLRKEVRLAVIPYRAEGRRDGELVSVDIPALEIPQCGNCGELLFTDHADRQVRRALYGERACLPERFRTILEKGTGTILIEGGVEHFIPQEDLCKVEARWFETSSADPARYDDIPNARLVLNALETWWAQESATSRRSPMPIPAEERHEKISSSTIND
jgi:hypothetical protein